MKQALSFERACVGFFGLCWLARFGGSPTLPLRRSHYPTDSPWEHATPLLAARTRIDFELWDTSTQRHDDNIHSVYWFVNTQFQNNRGTNANPSTALARN